jgi:hypothetical protein
MKSRDANLNTQVTMYVSEIWLGEQCVLAFDLPTHYAGVRPALCIVSVWVTGGSIPYIGIVLRDDPTK